MASLSCPLLNTLFFMTSLVVVFYNTEYIQGFVPAPWCEQSVYLCCSLRGRSG